MLCVVMCCVCYCDCLIFGVSLILCDFVGCDLCVCWLENIVGVLFVEKKR